MTTKETASSGIVVDATTGQRHVPSSTRADGSKRKEIRIRPGYQPPEDVKKYKNPSAEAWKNRGSGGVPGAEAVSTETQGASAASNKNAKRREARKKAKEAGEGEDGAAPAEKKTETEPAAEQVDPEAEKEKKARNLKKKLRQARDLREKKDKGESLLPEQFAKVIKINELIRELDALGFDAEGEKKPAV
jgi:partner of Y14 and mago